VGHRSARFNYTDAVDTSYTSSFPYNLPSAAINDPAFGGALSGTASR